MRAGFVAIFALWLIPCINGAEKGRFSDRWLLQQAKIGLDAASLIKFLEEQSPTGVDPEKIDVLIKDLGNADFQRRERASKDLVTIGPVSIEVLQKELSNKDPEIVRRAQACIDAIRSQHKEGLAMAAVRQLLTQPPDETVETLLRFLPFAPNEETTERIWYSLDAVGTSNGQVHPNLIAGLEDQSNARRAVSACLVGRCGNFEQKEAAKRLLDDSDQLVQLRAAQGLLAGNDCAGIPALINLLVTARLDIAWQAEELLEWVADGQTQGRSVGTGTNEQRADCHQKWSSWWKENEKNVNTARIAKISGSPALWLVSQRTSANRTDTTGYRIFLCGANRTPRWTIERLSNPQEAQLLLPERIQTIEIEGREGVYIVRDLSGNIRTKKPVDLNGRPVYRKNGNIVEFGGLSFREMDPSGNPIGSHRPKQVLGNTDTIHPLDNGLLLCTLRSNSPSKSQPIFELYHPQIQQAIVTVPATSALFRRTSRLLVVDEDEDGTFIANAHFGPVEKQIGAANELFAANHEGHITWQLPLPGADDVRHLRGNVFVVNQSDGSLRRVMVMMRNGQVKWEFCSTHESYVTGIWECFPLVRLGFGLRLDQSPNLDTVDFRIAALASKDVALRLWSLKRISEKADGADKGAPQLIDALDDENEYIQKLAGDILLKLGSKVSPLLQARLNDKRVRLRRCAVRFIAVIDANNPAIVRLMLEKLSDEDESIQQIAVSALGQKGVEAKDTTLPVLIKVCTDSKRSGKVREEAIRALQKFGPQADRAVPLLIELLPGADPSLSKAAASALGKIAPKNPTVVNALIEAIKDAHLPPTTRASVAWALGQSGSAAEEAVPAFRKILRAAESADSELFLQVVDALAAIGPKAKQAYPELMEVLQRKDAPAAHDEAFADHWIHIRCRAAVALGKIGVPAAVVMPGMSKVLKDSQFDPILAHYIKQTIEALTKE